MKQIYLIIFAFLFFSTFIAKGQGIVRWTDFDPIKVYHDRIYVGYKTYSDSTLTEEGKAFLYPRTLEIRKSKWLPGFIKVKVLADSIVLHGTVVAKLSTGKYRICTYDNGQKIEMKYFDPNGKKITRQEFYPGLFIDSDPEKGMGFYFYHGTKKQKK